MTGILVVRPWHTVVWSIEELSHVRARAVVNALISKIHSPQRVRLTQNSKMDDLKLFECVSIFFLLRFENDCESVILPSLTVWLAKLVITCHLIIKIVVCNICLAQLWFLFNVYNPCLHGPIACSIHHWRKPRRNKATSALGENRFLWLVYVFSIIAARCSVRQEACSES